MALKLAKELSGYVFEYWRIIASHTHYERGETTVNLGLYKDKDEREVHPEVPVDTHNDKFDLVDMTREDMYNALKETEYFLGAEDV